MNGDQELLEAWRAGDRSAGDRLFERHFDLLYAFFRNKVPGGVDDVVQKTMLACVEGRERISGNFAGYLIGAARRVLYREYDRLRRDGDRFDFGVTSAHEIAPSPSSFLAARAEQVLVHAALRRAPLDQQTALELRYFQGFRGPELATILDVPEGTVRSRLRRGLARVRHEVALLEASPAEANEAFASIATWAREFANEYGEEATADDA